MDKLVAKAVKGGSSVTTVPAGDSNRKPRWLGSEWEIATATRTCSTVPDPLSVREKVFNTPSLRLVEPELDNSQLVNEWLLKLPLV